MGNRLNKASILIATGGTGGHVFPSQALAKQLIGKGYDVLFMGKGLSSNSYFAKHLFQSISIDSATPFRKGILQKLLSFISLAKGTFQAFQQIGAYKPSLVVGFGSFHSFPVLSAAFLRGVPIALFESNSVPGKVNKLFSRYANFCGVQFPQAMELLKGTCYEVKMPFWKEVDSVSKKDALAYFSLKEDLFTVLVFGGSQGASYMNPIIAQALKQFHEENRPIQVIHMIGSASSVESIQSFYQEKKMTTSIKPFEENMHLAWSLADLVICRAGAATLAEMVEFGVPAILIPYPTAADQHQLKNALFLEKEVKGAFCLEEKKLTSESLLFLLKNCNTPQMKESILEFKKRSQKKQLIDHIEEFLHSKGVNHGKV